MKKNILTIFIILLWAALLYFINGTNIILISFIMILLLGLSIFDHIKLFTESNPKWKEKLEDFKYDIYHFYLIEKIRNFYYNMIDGISNIFKWWKIIWNDRDYDSGFVLKMMQFKFENMEKFFNSENTWSKNAKKDAKQIMVAKNLCGRLARSSDYFNNAMINHYKKYGNDLKIKFKPLEDESGRMLMINNRSEKEEKSFTRASEHADYMRNQDAEFLFVYLKKHLFSWWD